jgi:hypothetical protein
MGEVFDGIPYYRDIHLMRLEVDVSALTHSAASQTIFLLKQDIKIF